MKVEKYVLVANRIRKIVGSFCFIPHRFVREGFLSSLNRDELLVYFLLVLVSDRQGLSYYSQDRLCNLLRMCIEDFMEARNGLIVKDLLSFDGFIFQVLSLPEKPVHLPAKLLKSQEDFAKKDPLTARKLIQKSLEEAKG